MIEKELDIETSDGLMNTFITYPDEGGPYPVVLFLMDAMGKRNELHDMARRLAAAGYYVLLPNLYYRTIREYLPDWSDEENRDGNHVWPCEYNYKFDDCWGLQGTFGICR